MNVHIVSYLTTLVLLLPTSFAADPPPQLLAAGRVDQAIQTLQQQISHFPADADSYNLLCRAYFMLEDWDRGIPNCERAASLSPQNSRYYLWLGRIYGEKADRVSVFTAAGLAKKVRTSFERAITLDPKNWEARVDLAEFYAEAPGIIGGGKDKARQQANVLMSLKPAMAHWVLARIAEKDKDPAAAEREYRAEIEASGSGVRGWLDLANFFRYARRFGEMNQALRNMESAPIDYPESLMHGAGILLSSGQDFPLAVRLLRRYFGNGTVEEGPAFKAHDLLGQLLEKQGDRKAAAEQFRAALDLFHGYARAQEDLKRVEH